MTELILQLITSLNCLDLSAKLNIFSILYSLLTNLLKTHEYDAEIVTRFAETFFQDDDF